MSAAQRMSLLAGTLAALLMVFIVFQSVTQEVEPQSKGGGSAAEQPTYAPTNAREFAPSRMLVKLKEETPRIVLDNMNRRNNARVEERIPGTQIDVIRLPRDLPVMEAVRRYEASPDVEYAEPDFLLEPTATPNDPGYGKLYGLDNTGQSGGTSDADVDAPEAWNSSTGSPGTVVAVIDTGVDIKHPDLDGNIWVNTDEVPDNGIDDDRNGYVDDVHGYDFANDDASVYDPDPVSGKGDEHGTHVAGTIAAEGNNGVGVAGVNWEASIMVLKFLGPDGGYTSDAVEALNYALKNGATISNNSWGGGGSSRALQDAIAAADSAGHLFVAAAGNGGSDGVGDDNDATPFYPSSYNNANIISVAATNDDDALASFSNYGNNSVDLGAPGVYILSTLPGNSYGYYSGTSMATPHVSGVAALIKSQDPSLDDGQLKARVLQYVEPKRNLEGKVATGGRLNTYAAITQTMIADTTGPAITSVKPSSKTRDRTPNIAATVSDDPYGLSQSNIRFSLDGQERDTFSYDAGTERLSYQSGRLKYGKHTATITATDAAGNTATKTWTFKVVRR